MSLTCSHNGGLPEVVGTVQQMHCSRGRLLRRGLEFHVCTINKSAHTKKSLETYLMILVYIYNYIYLNTINTESTPQFFSYMIIKLRGSQVKGILLCILLCIYIYIYTNCIYKYIFMVVYVSICTWVYVYICVTLWFSQEK